MMTDMNHTHLIYNYYEDFQSTLKVYNNMNSSRKEDLEIKFNENERDYTLRMLLNRAA